MSRRASLIVGLWWPITRPPSLSMNLLETYSRKVGLLPEGPYLEGLRAVQRHIEAGFAHYIRGQESGEDSAFTDAIYRSNQAFEGSIKEAYRVLASKSPDRMRPSDIENHLAKEKIFRSRVLGLFTNYRTEWRNPSAHDYKLDFDESEALLALVSVSAFACLLVDQIAGRIAFDAARKEAQPLPKLRLNLTKPGDKIRLSEVTGKAVLEFANSPSRLTAGAQTEGQLVGALSGFLSATLPNSTISSDAILLEGRRERADILVSDADEKVVVEIKKHGRLAFGPAARVQLSHYMMLADAKTGILFLVSSGESSYETEREELPHGNGSILVIRSRTA